MRINKTLTGMFIVLLLGALFVPSMGLFGKSKDQVVLSKNNTVILNDEINGDTVSKVISDVRALGTSAIGDDSVYLFLNTPGGSIQAGLEMIEALNGLGRPIKTVTLFAASMGFQVAQNLDERLILKNGVLMSHRASGGFQGTFGGQRPSQIDSRYGLWLSRLNEMDEQTVKRTKGKQTLASYQKAYADELWLTGNQSVVGGYADRVVTVKCDHSLDGVTTHQVLFFGIKIAYDLDNCPINTSPMNIRIEMPSEKKVTPEETRALEARFLEQFINKQRSVIPMYW